MLGGDSEVTLRCLEIYAPGDALVERTNSMRIAHFTAEARQELGDTVLWDAPAAIKLTILNQLRPSMKRLILLYYWVYHILYIQFRARALAICSIDWIMAHH